MQQPHLHRKVQQGSRPLCRKSLQAARKVLFQNRRVDSCHNSVLKSERYSVCQLELAGAFLPHQHIALVCTQPPQLQTAFPSCLLTIAPLQLRNCGLWDGGPERCRGAETRGLHRHGVEAIMRRTAAAEHVCIKTEKLRTGYSQSKPSLVSEQLASEIYCWRQFKMCPLSACKKAAVSVFPFQLNILVSKVLLACGRVAYSTLPRIKTWRIFKNKKAHLQPEARSQRAQRQRRRRALLALVPAAPKPRHARSW